jgi:hypothetical protein
MNIMDKCKFMGLTKMRNGFITSVSTEEEDDLYNSLKIFANTCRFWVTRVIPIHSRVRQDQKFSLAFLL